MDTLVLLSGGMDSSTLLAKAREEAKGKVGALTIHYGQRHHREIVAAAAIAKHFGVQHEVFGIESCREGQARLFLGSSQTDASVPVPHGAYDAPTMKKTVVPNRNMILLALAGAYALSHGYDTIAYAAHSGDHTIYPDCRPEFVESLRPAFRICDWKPLVIWTPFLHSTKGEIVVEGLRLGVPFEYTWTCYEGGFLACGKCGACNERLEAFAFAGKKDPVAYEPGSPGAV